MKILQIDDLEDHTKLFSRILSTEGIEVEVANSSLKGLEMLQKNQYDILLLDIAMPEMDGLQLIEKLKECNLVEKMFIVIVSAVELSNVVEEKLLSSGVNKIIRKPVEIDKILEIIEEFKEEYLIRN